MGWLLRQCKLRYKYRKRTRTITAVLDEGYVRDDIPCGIQGCPHCVGPLAPSPHIPLVTHPTPSSPLVIPDGPALQHYLELWELPEVVNIIITTTATQQFTLKAGLRQVARLRALYRDRRRHVHLFDDRHCAWTHPGPGSSVAERLASVAEFYSQHLLNSTATGSHQPSVVIVSDALAGVTTPDQLVAQLQALSTSSAADADSRAFQQSQRIQSRYTVLTPAEYFLRYYRDQGVVQDLAESVLQARLAQAQAQATKGGSSSSTQPSTAAGSAGAAVEGTSGGDWWQRQFLPQHVLEEQLDSAQLLQGVLHVSQRGRGEEAVVHVGMGGGSDMSLGALVRVSGRQSLGRVMHGDRVAAGTPSITPQDPTTSHSQSQPLIQEQEDHEEPTSSGQRVLGVLETGESVGLMSSEPEGQAVDPVALVAAGGVTGLSCGEVVGLLARDAKPLVASLSPGDEQALKSMLAGGSGGQQKREAVLLVPYDRRFPLVRVCTRHPTRLMGQRLVVQIDDWPAGSRYPEGHVVHVLGPVNSLKAESEAVLHQAGIVHQPFCDAALAELPSVPAGGPSAWRPSPEERRSRRDLTGPEYYVCSIDPVGCTDVDDALHVRFLQDGTGRVEVGVHIADVSFFVRPNSVLDMEAADRCTSVYLVDRRLDMLPSLLSEQLCSLLGGVERYAVSVIWTLEEQPVTPSGGGDSETQLVVGDAWFGRTIIKSRHQLHYQQAQDILDGAPPGPGDLLPAEDVRVLRPALHLLKRYTDQLKGVRLANGALELESAEFKFKTNSSDGTPTDVVSKAKIPMMDVIAEMMIAANSAVAERIATTFPGAALLRCHPPPQQQALDQVRDLLHPPDATAGPPPDLTTNKGFSEALARACRRMRQRDSAAAQLIKGLATRAMSEAKYFSTGTAPPGTPAAYHYGLALQYYTHFTSPIRRYADVVVHRQLLAALAVSPGAPSLTPTPPLSHPQLVLAANRMNEQHRNAKRASQLCAELYLLLLLHKSPHVESALVVGLKEDGWVDLYIPAYQMQARMCMKDGRGVVRRPLQSEPLSDALVDSNDPYALSARRQLVYSVGSDRESAQVVDTALPQQPAVWQARCWGRVWVVLGAQEDAAHGPRLCIRPLSDAHPEVAGRPHPTTSSLASTDVIAQHTAPRRQQAVVCAAQHQNAAQTRTARTDVNLGSPEATGSALVPEPGQQVTAQDMESDTPGPNASVLVTQAVLPPQLHVDATDQQQEEPDDSSVRHLLGRMARLEAKLASVRLSSSSNKRQRLSEQLTSLSTQAKELKLVC